jgi:5'-methylthioadenosine phosphorylase
MEGVDIVEERTIDTPYGAPSDAIRLGSCQGVPVAFLPRHGRRHTITPSEINFRANIWALKSLGVEAILSVSAVGSLREAIAPGELVLVDQFIDRTRNRPCTFFHDGIAAHVSFADPVCPKLHALLQSQQGIVECAVHPRGTYICIEGPMFSSRAESHLFRSWNVDVVGMTNYQEAKLAREAEIPYATIALATDYDCWHTGETVSAAAVVAVSRKNVANAQRLIRAVLPRLHEAVTDSPACRALDGALMTHIEDIPAATRTRLAPIVERYVASVSAAA